MTFSLIAAVDKNFGMGKNRRLPWHLPIDLRYFYNTTVGHGKNVVIMGRATWESIPLKERPLNKRNNIVITRNHAYSVPKGVEKTSSFEEALKAAERFDPEQIFVIGGSRIFQEAIRHPQCGGIYLTEIEAIFDCDVFFPKIDRTKFQIIDRSQPYGEKGITFWFTRYRRMNLPTPKGGVPT